MNDTPQTPPTITLSASDPLAYSTLRRYRASLWNNGFRDAAEALDPHLTAFLEWNDATPAAPAPESERREELVINGPKDVLALLEPIASRLPGPLPTVREIAAWNARQVEAVIEWVGLYSAGEEIPPFPVELASTTDSDPTPDPAPETVSEATNERLALLENVFQGENPPEPEDGKLWYATMDDGSAELQVFITGFGWYRLGRYSAEREVIEVDEATPITSREQIAALVVTARQAVEGMAG